MYAHTLAMAQHSTLSGEDKHSLTDSILHFLIQTSYLICTTPSTISPGRMHLFCWDTSSMMLGLISFVIIKYICLRTTQPYFHNIDQFVHIQVCSHTYCTLHKLPMFFIPLSFLLNKTNREESQDIIKSFRERKLKVTHIKFSTHII